MSSLGLQCTEGTAGRASLFLIDTQAVCAGKAKISDPWGNVEEGRFSLSLGALIAFSEGVVFNRLGIHPVVN